MNMIPTPSKPIKIDLPEATEKDSPKFYDTVMASNGSVKIANTSENLQALADYYGIGFRFNMLEFEPEIYNQDGTTISLTPSQLNSQLISMACRNELPKAAIDDHLMALSEDNKYHPVKHWLDAGEWDGIKRIDSVIKCLNAEHEALAVAVIKHWLVGCVASLYETNFSSKLVPVLQGGQSFKKTAFVSRIANIQQHAFLEGAELNPDNKDSLLSCIRSFIVELGELERTNKNSQGSLKAFITKSIDTTRPPYARNDIKKPRQTHFIATVNGDNFLKDETGSNRFVVLAMKEAANMDALNKLLGWSYDGTGKIKQQKPELLKQFWLEVKALYSKGFGWMLSEKELTLAASVNDSFDDKGGLYEYIRDNYIKENSSCLEWITAGELVKADKDLPSHSTVIIGKALKRLSNEQSIKKRIARGNKTEYQLHIERDINGYFPYYAN